MGFVGMHSCKRLMLEPFRTDKKATNGHEQVANLTAWKAGAQHSKSSLTDHLLLSSPSLCRVRGLLDMLEASRLRDRNPGLMAAAEDITKYAGAEK